MAPCSTVGKCQHFFYPEDGGSMFLRNIIHNLSSCTASHARRRIYLIQRKGWQFYLIDFLSQVRGTR
jgi:hypothetical protein